MGAASGADVVPRGARALQSEALTVRGPRSLASSASSTTATTPIAIQKYLRSLLLLRFVGRGRRHRRQLQLARRLGHEPRSEQRQVVARRHQRIVSVQQKELRSGMVKPQRGRRKHQLRARERQRCVVAVVHDDFETIARIVRIRRIERDRGRRLLRIRCSPCRGGDDVAANGHADDRRRCRSSTVRSNTRADV